MRKILALLAALLVLAAVPVTAQENLTQPCEDTPHVDTSVADFIVGVDGITETVATPDMVSPYPTGVDSSEPDPLGFRDNATAVYTVMVDASPNHLSAVADVAIDWEQTGDIDLDLYRNGAVYGESHSFNPQDGNGEAASAGRLDHCGVFEVHIRNYISTPGDVEVDITLSSLRD